MAMALLMLGIGLTGPFVPVAGNALAKWLPTVAADFFIFVGNPLGDLRVRFMTVLILLTLRNVLCRPTSLDEVVKCWMLGVW